MAPGKGWRWGHEEGWADPDIVGLVGAGTEVLARIVKDCHGSVGESLSGP